MTSAGYGPYGIPGFNAARETIETDVVFGNPEWNQAIFKSVVIDSTAVGSSTPTSVLYPGQVMAELDSGAGWVDYDPDATDGSQHAKGVLLHEVNLLDPATSANADRYARVMIAGPVKVNTLIDLDYQARAQLRAGGFLFDDDRWAGHGREFSHVEAKSSDYTVVVADSGTLFTTGGASEAVNFTLPAAADAVGCTFTFLNVEDQNMTVTSAEGDNIIGFNNATADSVSFQTSSKKIGGCFKVHGIFDGATASWFAQALSAGDDNTVTTTDS